MAFTFPWRAALPPAGDGEAGCVISMHLKISWPLISSLISLWSESTLIDINTFEFAGFVFWPEGIDADEYSSALGQGCLLLVVPVLWVSIGSGS